MRISRVSVVWPLDERCGKVGPTTVVSSVVSPRSSKMASFAVKCVRTGSPESRLPHTLTPGTPLECEEVVTAILVVYTEPELGRTVIQSECVKLIAPGESVVLMREGTKPWHGISEGRSVGIEVGPRSWESRSTSISSIWWLFSTNKKGDATTQESPWTGIATAEDTLFLTL